MEIKARETKNWKMLVAYVNLPSQLSLPSLRPNPYGLATTRHP